MGSDGSRSPVRGRLRRNALAVDLGTANTVVFRRGEGVVLFEPSVVAIDERTGETKWKVNRDEVTSWATPLVIDYQGKAQVIVPATNKVRSYDLATGEVIWQCGGLTVNVIPSPVVAGKVVYCMSGYRGAAVLALPLGAKGVLCTQRVEVVAPDGTSCGATDYPIAGGTCDTLDLNLGADGTIIQQLPGAMEQTNSIVGGHTCTWRWWPAALR